MSAPVWLPRLNVDHDYDPDDAAWGASVHVSRRGVEVTAMTGRHYWELALWWRR